MVLVSFFASNFYYPLCLVLPIPKTTLKHDASSLFSVVFECISYFYLRFVPFLDLVSAALQTEKKGLMHFEMFKFEWNVETKWVEIVICRNYYWVANRKAVNCRNEISFEVECDEIDSKQNRRWRRTSVQYTMNMYLVIVLHIQTFDCQLFDRTVSECLGFFLHALLLFGVRLANELRWWVKTLKNKIKEHKIEAFRFIRSRWSPKVKWRDHLTRCDSITRCINESIVVIVRFNSLNLRYYVRSCDHESDAIL